MKAFRPFTPIEPELPKAAVRRLVDQAGGIKRVAARLGYKGDSQVYAMTQATDPAEITFAQVSALTDRSSPAAAEYLAQLAGGAFLPLPSPDSPLAVLTAEAMREAGQAGAALVEALQDGRCTASEARKAMPEAEAVVRVFAQLVTQLQLIARSTED